MLTQYLPLGGWALSVGLVMGLLGQPVSAATEEVTVYGGSAAAEFRALERRFDQDMAAYAKAVGSEFKTSLQSSLRESILREIKLAGDVRTRG